MSNYPWFKQSNDMPNSAKIRKVTRMCSSLSRLQVVGAWTMILCMASESPTRGTLLIAKNTPYNRQDIADELELTTSETDDLLNSFEAVGMLEYANESWHITGWEKQQGKRDSTNAERQKRYRERRRNAARNVTVTLRETNLPLPDIDQDIDQDIDPPLPPKGEDALVELVDYFSEITEISPPKNLGTKSATERWLQPIVDIYKVAQDFEQTKQAMQKAAHELNAKNLTIAAPRSVRATAIRLLKSPATQAQAKYEIITDENGVY